MATINLLPWREELRAERKKEFIASLALMVLAAILILFVTDLMFDSRISFQERRNAYVRQNIVELDDFSVRSLPFTQISFSEIKNFKGLENEVIIVTNLDNPKTLKNNFNKTNHYIAMSRARALLCAIWNDERT